MAKLVVVEGPAGGFTDALLEARAEGLQVVDGWRVPPAAGEYVCAGVVADAEDAAAALLAALAGARIVVHAQASRAVVDRLCEDLRRLGHLDHRTTSTARTPALSAEQRSLLGLLAEGLTLGEAATRLHLSRRTADRRLASARRLLGVETNAEAVVSFSRRAG